VTRLSRPLRWTLALVVTVAASVALMLAAPALPFDGTAGGAMLRAGLTGAVFVAMMALLKLGRRESSDTRND
jgi:hypothetical protein